MAHSLAGKVALVVGGSSGIGRAGALALAEAGAKVVAAAIAELPFGRVGKPAEVAAAVVWLCSERASFVTGHSLPADGGHLAVA